MGNDARMSGEPFTFKADTIAGRRWRVIDGWLQFEAMGWENVFQVGNDGVELARRLAWLSGAPVPGSGISANELHATAPPVPPWGRRGLASYRRSPFDSRAAHGNGVEFCPAVKLLKEAA